MNQLGREEIQSFNERARFLPKWHDLCEGSLGRQLDAAPDLERLHALRDGILLHRATGAARPPFADPSPEVPQMLLVETARWAVDAAAEWSRSSINAQVASAPIGWTVA